MVSSPMYERLKEFMKAAQANQDLDAWNGDHDKVIKGFEQSIQQLQAYREGHGFTGATGDAMNDWVDASIKRIEWYRTNYERGYKSYEAGRKVMASALAEAQTVSAHLLDAKTEAMRDDWVVAVSDEEPGGGITFMGKRYTTGAAYVEAVEAQANAQREAAAERILAQMNAGTNRMSEGMRIGAPPTPSKVPDDKDIIETGWDTPDNSSGGTPPVWDRTGDDSYGRDTERDPSSPSYPDGFKQPWWSAADEAAARNRIVSSGAVPTRELPYGELGSRTNPISDPQDLMGTDLLHKSVNGTTYRNGVIDGHTPAPPADAQHPLWRLNGGAAADAATAGRLGGAGVLGAGALGMRGAARMGSGSGFGGLGGATRMGSGFGGLGGASGSAGGMGAGGMGGLRGISGTTGSAGAMGASNLRVGTYSGSGFGSYTPPASVAGANGAAGAGASSVTGTTGAGGSGAAGAAGAAGRGGAGTGGGFMGGGGAGAGAGMGKDDKKGRKRKYVAFTVDEDEDDLPAGYVNPLSQTYGTDRTISPVKREDDGWDLRQW